MKKFLVVALLAACHSDQDRLSLLEKRIDALEHQRPAAAPARRPGPDPQAVYYLPVRDTDVVRGVQNAKVTLVEGFDFACPFCALSTGVVEQVLKARPDTVRVVSKNFVVHPQIATTAALGACAAQRQGHGPAYEQALWAKAWKTEGQAHFDQQQLTDDALSALAKSIGLDGSRFAGDLKGECARALSEEQRELAAIGVNGTPSFFINGRVYTGPRTLEGFLSAIDEEAKKAEASGSHDYYESLMKTAKRTL